MSTPSMYDVALVGLEQTDQRLEEDRLAGAGRAEHHADLAGGDGEGDVAPDELLAEGLGQSVDLDLDAHGSALPARSSRMRTTTYAGCPTSVPASTRGRAKLARAWPARHDLERLVTVRHADSDRGGPRPRGDGRPVDGVGRACRRSPQECSDGVT